MQSDCLQGGFTLFDISNVFCRWPAVSDQHKHPFIQVLLNSPNTDTQHAMLSNFHKVLDTDYRTNRLATVSLTEKLLLDASFVKASIFVIDVVMVIRFELAECQVPVCQDKHFSPN